MLHSIPYSLELEKPPWATTREKPACPTKTQDSQKKKKKKKKDVYYWKSVSEEGLEK